MFFFFFFWVGLNTLQSSLHRTRSWPFTYHIIGSWQHYFIISRIGLMAPIFSTSWFKLMAYASFYGMGLNLHHAMSSQIGSIIASLIWWAHGLPFSHLTDWAGSPFVFLLKGSRVKTQGSHCFSRLFMEGFPIKLVHLVLFRYKTGLIT